MIICEFCLQYQNDGQCRFGFAIPTRMGCHEFDPGITKFCANPTDFVEGRQIVQMATFFGIKGMELKKVKRIATLEVSKPTLPQTSHRIKIDFPVRQQSGQIVLRADHLSKRYGTKEVFRNISLQVERGQRRLPYPQPPDRGSRTGPGRDWSGRSPHGHCPQQS